MKSCHFYRIAQCSSENSMTLSSFSMTFPWFSMTFAIFHDFPGLENGLPKFHDFFMTFHDHWATCLYRKATITEQKTRHSFRRWHLRDVGQRVADVETETIEVLPLVSGHRRPDVVGDDLSFVEQVLDDEHDRCTERNVAQPSSGVFR